MPKSDAQPWDGDLVFWVSHETGATTFSVVSPIKGQRLEFVVPRSLAYDMAVRILATHMVVAQANGDANIGRFGEGERGHG